MNDSRGNKMTSSIDINSLTSLEDIQAAYDALSTEELTVVSDLDAMVANGSNLDQKLVTISSLAPQFAKVSDAK